MSYLSYDNIIDQTLEQASDIINTPSWIPWISSEKIDAKIWLANMPATGSSDTIDIVWWNTTVQFFATDYMKVSWSGWDINLPNWKKYSIVAWDTGNMSAWAINYIYLDVNVSETALQKTTTASTAVWSGKLMVCVAQRNTDTTKKAVFQWFGWNSQSMMVAADNIAANSITANEMNVNTLSAISANLWTITAGDITGATFKTAATGKRIEISTQSWNNMFAFYNNDWFSWSIEADDTERSISISGYYWFIVAVPNTIQLNGTNVNLKATYWYITLDWATKTTWNIDVWWTQVSFVNNWQIATDNWPLTISSFWFTMDISTSNSMTLSASNIVMDSILIRANWHLRPMADAQYNLWTSSNRWNDFFCANLNTSQITTWWAVQSATTTSNRYVLMWINWTTYKLLLATT